MLWYSASGCLSFHSSTKETGIAIPNTFLKRVSCFHYWRSGDSVGSKKLLHDLYIETQLYIFDQLNRILVILLQRLKQEAKRP